MKFFNEDTELVFKVPVHQYSGSGNTKRSIFKAFV